MAIFCVYKLSVTEASSLLFQSGESKYNTKYFDNFTIEIINNTLNLDFVIIKPLTRGFKVHLDFSISLGKTKHYQSVFSHIVDNCGVVAAVKSNIFKTWFQSMLDHGNFMYNCPVIEGHYFLHNWKLDSQLVPQYLYAGDYRITGHFFFGKLKTKREEFVLDLTVFALLKRN
ncbi:uncharacterized protein LOC117782916 [Drosophila innubila]|uniref:uncharacterized protein LOC117782916 n=1 Tax=Drosophila innubila TaxID=198719 RepID=UPI00148E4D05|nr:uncharacterized protein LOC117782916 [Drosophila innubila]